MDKKLIFYLALTLAFVLLIFHRRQAIKKSHQALQNCGEFTVGSILSIRQPVSKMPVVFYEYKVEEEVFKASESVEKKSELDYIKKFDKIRVKYECSNPMNSIIIYPGE